MADTHEYPDGERHDRLRRSARALLDEGASPRNSGGALGVDALQLLYERASTPESAAEALRLLHELQTYQVELDLLYEQLQANEGEITEELTHYKTLFELAPAAYLMVAGNGEIIEGNQAAGTLFGETTGTLRGRSLFALLASGQDGLVNGLLAGPEKPASGTDGVSSTPVELPDHRQVMVRARPVATGEHTLMLLTETAKHAPGS